MAVRILGIGGVEAEVSANNALRVLPMQDATGSRIFGQGLYALEVLGSNGAEVVIETDGISALSFQIFGTFVGTVSFFASNDGTNQFPITAFNTATNVGATSTTAAAAFYLPTAYKNVILRMTTYTSGAATAAVSAQPFASPLPITTVTSTLLAGGSTGGVVIGSVRIAGAPLMVATTGTAGAAATLTLPAGGANNFAHINYLRLEAHASAATTAGSAPIAITTTALNGLAFTMESRAKAAGESSEKHYTYAEPLRSQTANTAVTIVMPATPNVIWHAHAAYRVGV
jgi:hypothetical protein